MGFFDFMRKKQASGDAGSYFSAISDGIRNVISGRNNDPLNEYHGWVFACVNAIAENVAMIDLHLVRKNGDEIERIYDHPALDVLKNVNPYMTFFELVVATQSFLELEGNAFWLLLRSGSRIEYILPIRPDFMEVVQDEKNLVGGYVYTLDGKKYRLSRDEVIHFRTFNPKNFFRGSGVVRAASQAIQSENFANTWNQEFFKNSARPDVVLQYESNLTDAQRKTLLERWNDQHKGAEKGHRTAVASGGLKIVPLGYGQKDMDFVNMAGMNREKILSTFGVPKEILGIFDGTANRASAEMAEYVFMKQKIKPKMTKFVGTLNELFLPLFGGNRGEEFTFTNPVPEDREMELREIESGMKSSYMKINEARARRGLPPVKDGNKFLIPMGMELIDADEEIPRKKAHIIDINAKDATPYSKMASVITLHLKKALEVSEFEKKGAKWHGEQLKRASKPEQDLIDNLEAYFDDLKLSVLKAFDKQLGNKRMKIKIPDLMDLDEEAKKLIEEMEPILLRVVGIEVESALELVGIAEGIKKAQERVKEAFKRPLEKFAGLITDETSNQIRNAIAAGLEEGESMTEIRKRIESLAGFNKSRAETIARTEIARAQNYASVQAWKDSEVVEKKIWFTAEDERVEKACNDLHGKEFDIDAAIASSDIGKITEPPLHPNCRCTLLPVVSEEKSVRASRNNMSKDLDELERLNKLLDKSYG